MKNLFKVFLLPIFFIGLTPSCAQADPPLPPFYEAVIKMSPEGKLGQILKQEKIKTSVKGAQAWRVAYISSDVGERKTIATGVAIAPLGVPPKEGRPILAWAHGTTGSAQNCGPSQIIDPTAPLLEALSKIEVVRGAASLQYGSQFGGLLNYQIKKGNPNKPISFETQQTVGSYGLFNTYNALGGTYKKFSFYVAFDFLKSPKQFSTIENQNCNYHQSVCNCRCRF